MFCGKVEERKAFTLIIRCQGGKEISKERQFLANIVDRTFFRSKKYGSMRFFFSRCFHKNTWISTMNPVLELLVEFFQDSIGLNCGLEFRSAGSE